ncbi:MAG: hypothetical protein KGK16_08020 [Bradyrhizobium sp.]|uniref:hypothetical protein n=1 Tax=Bradyrhizobium sp. TaxID=376 RepID=UPI00238989A9|nr:hypothetical protein [Bradyrhizobium sp.]MDE2330712.1 hypothetical protein [Bradyrhizobium sp.]MDE2604153.1 hypothetical protein [Bradyrhizobium sp.]
MRTHSPLPIVGIGFCSAISAVDVASAQLTLPAAMPCRQAKPESGAAIIAYLKEQS